MATNSLTPNLARWNAALADYEAADAAFVAIRDHPRSRSGDQISALATESARQLFQAPAPTIGAVRRKLECLWGDLSPDTCATKFKRIIIGDLRRIELLRLGVDPYEASGGMDLHKLGSDFSEVSQEFDRCVQARGNCRSDVPGGSAVTGSAQVEDAEARMLSLSAPDLVAVEKKLTAMWRSDRYGPNDETNARVAIIQDLHRLISCE